MIVAQLRNPEHDVGSDATSHWRYALQDIDKALLAEGAYPFEDGPDGSTAYCNWLDNERDDKILAAFQALSFSEES